VSVFAERSQIVLKPIRLTGGPEGFPERGAPYQMTYFVSGRSRWQLTDADWRTVIARVNRDRPARELGIGTYWRAYRVESDLVQTFDSWREYRWKLRGWGDVGFLHLIFEEGGEQ